LIWSAAAEGEDNETSDAALAEPERHDRIFAHVSRCESTYSFNTGPEEKRCRRGSLPSTRASFLGTVQGKLPLCHRTPSLPLYIADFQPYARPDGVKLTLMSEGVVIIFSRASKFGVYDVHGRDELLHCFLLDLDPSI
jgi:hypothetical protein